MLFPAVYEHRSAIVPLDLISIKLCSPMFMVLNFRAVRRHDISRHRSTHVQETRPSLICQTSPNGYGRFRKQECAAMPQLLLPSVVQSSVCLATAAPADA